MSPKPTNRPIEPRQLKIDKPRRPGRASILARREASSSLELYARAASDVKLAADQLHRLFAASTEIHGTLIVAHGALVRATASVKKMIAIEEA